MVVNGLLLYCTKLEIVYAFRLSDFKNGFWKNENAIVFRPLHFRIIKIIIPLHAFLGPGTLLADRYVYHTLLGASIHVISLLTN